MSLALHRIKSRSNDLRLREDAPFPSEVEDAQHAIRQWRHEQLVRRLDRNNGYPDSGYCDVDSFVEGLSDE
jgi:hypothetical protein